MTRRYYRNGQATALTAPMDAVQTSLEVDQASSFPTQFPYTLIVDPNGVLEEVVEVSNAVGTTLTVTRGVDGTTASAHSAGAIVFHGVSARDHDETNAHVNATTNIHGVTGGLVGLAGNQTIAGDKSFTGAVTVGGSAVMTLGAVQTVPGKKTFDDLETTAGGDVMTLGATQTVTGNKTYTGTETHQGAETHSGTATFTGGLNTSAGAVVAVAGAQTISSKTLDNSNVLPIKGNTETVNTDAGGFAVVTHGVGHTPDYVVATCHNTNAFFCAIQARTSTTFTVIINDKNGTVLASGAITISWIAR